LENPDAETETKRPPLFIRLVFKSHAKYVWELRVPFIVCLSLFFVSLLGGFFLGNMLPTEVLEEVLGSIPEMEDWSLPFIFVYIIVNNVSKSFIWMLLGIALGILPLLFVMINGFFVGWISYTTSIKKGFFFTVAALLPHGVVEIPAILLSMAAGIGLGVKLVKSLRKQGSLKQELRSALSLYIFRIVPSLVLAAVLEVTLTPLIIYLLGFKAI